ncbi:MFS general substrate transporter, partial [Aureobasidium melanogenum]
MHEEIVSTLVDKAAGMFRWAYCQLQELSECLDKPAVRRILHTLPNDLNGTYDRILQNIPASRVPNAIKLLQLLTFSKRPLLLEGIIDAIATEPDMEPPFDTENRISPPDAVIGYCANLVRITTAPSHKFEDDDFEISLWARLGSGEERTIQLAHFSVREYLLLNRKENPYQQYFDERVAHAAITRIYPAYIWTAAEAQRPWTVAEAQRAPYSESELESIEYAEGRRDRESASKFPLIMFAARNWMDHAATAGEEEEITFAWTRKLFTDSNFMWCWARVYDYREARDTSALYYASRFALHRSVRYLLSRGADPNARGGTYGSALTAAATSGDVHIAQILLDHGASINAEDGEFGYALHAAAWYGHVDTLQLLLGYGADTGTMECEKRIAATALQVAAWQGHTEVVKRLLMFGADVNQRSIPVPGGYDKLAMLEEYDTALEAASAAGHIEVVKILLNNNAEVDARGDGPQSRTPLQAASQDGYLDVVRLLVQSGADINVKSGFYGYALHAALTWACTEVSLFLIESGADVQARGGYHETTLNAAARGSNLAMVRLLIEKGVDIHQCNRTGESALIEACAARSHNVQVVELLLDSGADVNAQGGYDGTALCVASAKGSVELVRMLLDAGADVTIQAGEFNDALQSSCGRYYTERTNQELVKLLLDSGAEVNAQGGEHGTALCAASKDGDVEVVRLLLDNGADVNAQGGEYGTALHAASLRGQAEVVRLLLDSGAEVNAQVGRHGTALRAAFESGFREFAIKETVQVLLERGADPNAQNEGTDTLLYMASYGEDLALATMLLAHGADPNVQGGELGTALAAALYNGSLEMVQMLLENGADPNAQNEDTDTLLYMASYGEDLASATMLLAHGAGPNVQGGNIGTAIAVASYRNSMDLVQLLLDNGADVNSQGGWYGNALQSSCCSQSYVIGLGMIQLLLNNGASINARGGEYGTALCAASSNGELEVVKLLLREGADVDAPGGKYHCALCAAAYKGHIDVARVLLENGAVAGTSIDFHEFALQDAIEQGNLDIAELLFEQALKDATKQGNKVVAELLFEEGVLKKLTKDGANSNLTLRIYSEHERVSREIIKRLDAPLQRRPAIMGIVSSMWGVASAAGPLLGGVFTDKVSWRWCFYINLPIGALTMIMIAFLLQVPRLDNAEQLSLWQRIKKLDLIGAFLLIHATVCLLLALQWGGTTYPWNNPRMIALFVVGGVLTIAFVYSQSKLRSKATLPPYLFKNRSTLCAFIFSGLFGAGFFSLTYYLSVYFQSVKGSSSLHSGIQMLPLLISSSVSSTCTGLLISRLGYYTPFIIVCMALFACGAGLLTSLSITTPYAQNLGYQIITGFGVGIGFEGGIIAVQTVLSGRDIPVAISVVSFFMTIGGAIFVPISQTVFQNGFLAAIETRAPQLDGHVFLKAGATQIRAILSMMREEDLLDSVLQAYCHALQHVFWVVTACAIAAVIAACGLEWKSVRKA